MNMGTWDKANPNLTKQWHPTKNLPLTPTGVTIGSKRKVWWICSKGHEWQAVIYSRCMGCGCPYCSGRIACDDNCLARLNPTLEKEWHPTKNVNLTPFDVTQKSGKKVWWICEKGHEWQAVVASRSAGRGCPYCSGNAVCNDNCLANSNPDLSKEWHPTKNLSLAPTNVTIGSSKKVWWTCKKGHEWQASIYERNNGGSCPYCLGRAVCEENCLSTLNPDLAKQWHPIKNQGLTSKDVTTGSNKKVWWLCDKGHEWQATIVARSRGNGCPYCSHRIVDTSNCLATLNPVLTKEWHPTKNGDLLPCMVILGTHKKVWWSCIKNANHEWQAAVVDRNNGSSCPYCSGKLVDANNCLANLNPVLSKEWHPTKNCSLTPNMITSGSNRKVWWTCVKGHEWQATVSERNSGRGCPYCSGRTACDGNCLTTMNPILAKEWHPTKNGNLMPENVTLHSGKKVWWVCSKDHEWQATVNSRSSGVRCPYCYSKISQLELRVYCELKYLFTSTISRKKISGKECDVYIPEIQAGVEVDGVYWHRNKYKQDKQKSDTIKSEGITLIRVREAGLRRISSTDIMCTQTDNALTIVKKIVKVFKAQCSLDSTQKNNIDTYLRRRKFVNESEYKILWDILPSPFPGFTLLDLNHELAKEWHPVMNGSLKPENVSLYSRKKVWWICDKGHRWQATIGNRSHGDGCPCCSGKAVCKDNCLANINPEVAKQWHPTKNSGLMPENVTAYSKKKVWWSCQKNRNHEWQTTVGERSRGRGCPYCSGKAVCKDNCLATINPEVAKQWHPTKNENLKPSMVTPNSSRKVWWLCQNNRKHEWQTTIQSRNNGYGCPYCSGQAVCIDNCLATLNPTLAKEWHPTRNGDLTPSMVTIGSNRMVWWICHEGHEWQAKVYIRGKGRGCPKCRISKSKNTNRLSS